MKQKSIYKVKWKVLANVWEGGIALIETVDNRDAGLRVENKMAVYIVRLHNASIGKEGVK